MKRKDMIPGTIYAIRSSGMIRPGVVLDSTYERISVRVWWTWPPADFDASSMDYRETDYLDPKPGLTSPYAKYDDKIVKTSDVIAEWEPWATAAKADRTERLARAIREEREAEEAVLAERANNRKRIEAVAPLLQDTTGYLGMNGLLSDVNYGWTQNHYSARDVVELLEAIASKTIGVVGS